MRLFKEEGRLNKFSRRESVGKNIDKEDELREWKKYMEKSDNLKQERTRYCRENK